MEVYDQDNQSIIRRYDDMHLVSEIQQTLDTDGFELMSQPIVPLADDNDQIRFEILLRMKDSKGNKVSSDAFFSAAERYQLMPQIDRWVVSTTLSKLGEHTDYLEASGASFAINLSGQSLGDDDILEAVSIGIAGFDAKATDVADALTASRIACDSAKDHGRDRVEVYDQDNQSIIRRYDDMHLVSEIQQTLDTDGFELMSQPIVPLADDNDQIRFEILLRMKDSKGNKVSSDAFFSAAERYQLMPQIDRWVVSTTLSKLGEHTDYLESSGASFAINLSGQSLGDDDILKFIEGEMESSDCPDRLMLKLPTLQTH